MRWSIIFHLLARARGDPSHSSGGGGMVYSRSVSVALSSRCASGCTLSAIVTRRRVLLRAGRGGSLSKYSDFQSRYTRLQACSPDTLLAVEGSSHWTLRIDVAAAEVRA